MEKKKLYLIGAGAIVVILALVFLLLPDKTKCDYSYSEELSDGQMVPILGSPTKVKIYPNWYNCNGAQKGELGIYFLGTPSQRYIRAIAAVKGDEVALQQDANGHGWNLIVNDELLMSGENPLWFGVPSIRPTLSLYVNAQGKRMLTDKEIVLNALLSPGYMDSGLFGLFDTATLKGRIILSEEHQKKMNEVFRYEKIETKISKTFPAVAPPPGTPTHLPPKPLVKPKPAPPKKALPKKGP